MILTDREIHAAIRSGQITISPEPAAEAYSSTSLDLTLDTPIQLWETKTLSGVEGPIFSPGDTKYSSNDVVKAHTKPGSIPPEGYILEPGTFVLAWTREKVRLPHQGRLAARVEGKSSLARLGVTVHVTAPTIHAGFGGQIQLEMCNLGPLRVRLLPGMRVCQLIFEMSLGTPEKGYAGMFAGQTSSSEAKS